MAKNLDVLYENDTCLVINKPAGLAVQGGEGIAVSLDSILSEKYSPRPLLVHRLDKDTSGIILVAKNKSAAAAYSCMMGEEGAVIKRYLAVCSGIPAEAAGVICLDIEIRGKIKKSKTRYTVNSAYRDFSLLELELGSGRMHQIRRHLALTGNPVLGDDKYGNFALNKELRKTMKLKHLLLHAHRLQIPGTTGIQPLDLYAPLPDYFTSFLDKTANA